MITLFFFFFFFFFSFHFCPVLSPPAPAPAPAPPPAPAVAVAPLALAVSSPRILDAAMNLAQHEKGKLAYPSILEIVPPAQNDMQENKRNKSQLPTTLQSISPSSLIPPLTPIHNNKTPTKTTTLTNPPPIYLEKSPAKKNQIHSPTPHHPPNPLIYSACTAVIPTKFSISAICAFSCASCACRCVYCLLRLRVEEERVDWDEGGWEEEVDEGRFGPPPTRGGGGGGVGVGGHCVWWRVWWECWWVVSGVCVWEGGRCVGGLMFGWLEGGRLGATRYRAVGWFYTCKATEDGIRGKVLYCR